MSFLLPINRVRAIMRWVLAVFYVAAGIAHLMAPAELIAITPSWVPLAPQVIFITGLCEFAGAIALVTKPLRWWAGVALAAYAICVWPANFKHAIDHIQLPHFTSSWFYHGSPDWRFSRCWSGGPCSAPRSSTGHGVAGPNDDHHQAA